MDARVVLVAAAITQSPPVRLAFAWAKQDYVPVILGQVNFFMEFDVCFFRSHQFLKSGPRAFPRLTTRASAASANVKCMQKPQVRVVQRLMLDQSRYAVWSYVMLTSFHHCFENPLIFSYLDPSRYPPTFSSGWRLDLLWPVVRNSFRDKFE